jgi:hypothetical protein
LRLTVEDRSVPLVAVWLGGLGVVPFLACSALILVGPPELVGRASDALAAYGAVILSFLGGVQWGFATGDAHAARENGALLRRLSVSVLPSLVAWTVLLAPREPGFVVLAGTFLLVLLVDIRAARSDQAPAWYPSLRWPLTLLVVASLIGATLA